MHTLMKAVVFLAALVVLSTAATSASEYEAWCQDVNLVQAAPVSFRESKFKGFQVIATEDIFEAKILFNIPMSHIITHGNALDSFSPELKNTTFRDASTRFALALVYHYLHENTPLHLFARLLDFEQIKLHPLTYPVATLKELQKVDFTAFDIELLQTSLTEDYNLLMEHHNATVGDMLRNSAFGGLAPHHVLLYFSAFALQQTRALPVLNDEFADAIVPCISALSHCNEYTGLVFSRSGVIFTPLRDATNVTHQGKAVFPAGSEVCLSYGRLSNSDLFRNFGIVPKENPHNNLWIDISNYFYPVMDRPIVKYAWSSGADLSAVVISPKDPLKWINAAVRLSLDPYLNTQDPALFDEILAKKIFQNFEDIRDETDVAFRVHSLLKAIYVTRPTTIEDDEDTLLSLAGEEDADQFRLVVEYRLESKKMLLSALAVAHQRHLTLTDIRLKQKIEREQMAKGKKTGGKAGASSIPPEKTEL